MGHFRLLILALLQSAQTFSSVIAARSRSAAARSWPSAPFCYKLGTGVHIPLRDFDPATARAASFCSAVTAAVVGIPSELTDQGPSSGCRNARSTVFLRLVFLRVPWFTNYAPSGSVNAPEPNFGPILRTPIERYLLCLIFVTVFAAPGENLVRGLGRHGMAIRDMA